MSNLRAWLAEKSSEERELFLSEVPRLWLEGGQVKKLCRLLTDFDFIEAKINHPKFGVQALIEDYDLIDDTEFLTYSEYDAQTVKALRLIQGALRLSAHILNEDTKQLGGQLSGRLLHFDAPEIQGLLQQISQTKITWLRPLTASLTPPGGALVRTLTGHSHSVNAVAVTPDCKYVISASSDKTLKVWDLQSGKEKFTLNGHSYSVNAVTVSTDSKYVISGSFDGTLKVWYLQFGEEKFTFKNHDNSVNAVTVTRDGKNVISGSLDGTLKLWNLDGKQSYLLSKNSAIKAITLTTDGNSLITYSEDKNLNVIDLTQSQKPLFRKTLFRRFDVVFSLILVKLFVFLKFIDETFLSIFLYMLFHHYFTLSLVGLFLYLIGKIILLFIESSEVISLTVTTDGKRIVTGCKDKSIKIWNIKNKKQIFTLRGHSESVTAVAITLNGKYLVSASEDKTLKVWNLETEKECFTLTGHSASVNTLAVTPDDKWIISGSDDKTIKVWDLENRKEIFNFRGHNKSISTVTVTPCGKQVVSTSLDKTLQVWNLESGEIIASFTGESEIKCCAVASDGVTIVAGEESGRLHFLRLKGIEAKP
ncbi:beta-propeller domain-containing protein [Brasilonema octagenarum]|uniref:WD40 repeat domain-containing protein n=1 Tax=Brasilonema octagenarum UFV-OR1 TaxID=417115 RepID=A0ABX1MAB8_9CYAN|nr:hypothetical protein [Brasilonema octagenarum]NMF65537.1 hypothetical protein [Brasilonema octagenarum UFV-OR1]